MKVLIMQPLLCEAANKGVWLKQCCGNSGKVWVHQGKFGAGSFLLYV